MNITKNQKTINSNWKSKQKEEVGKAKKNNTKHTEIKLELTKDKFVNNIPKTITSPETLVGLVTSKIAPEIRANVKAQFAYTDSAAIQALGSKPKISVTETVVNESVESEEILPDTQVLTDQIMILKYYQELF